jgi:hypothetical protein
MIPSQYATIAAGVLTFGGALSCFLGYRLFRIVLGLYGFLIGAYVTSLVMGQQASAFTLVMAVLGGGVLGAILMVAAYFMGVGLIGAGLAALLLNLVWRFVGGEPPTWLLVLVAVIGALGALSIVRHVVIFGTAIAGAWTLIVGGLALAGSPAAARAASTGDVWVFYPLGPTPGEKWQLAAWFLLSVAGVAVQIATTKAKSTSRAKAKSK